MYKCLIIYTVHVLDSYSVCIWNIYYICIITEKSQKMNTHCTVCLCLNIYLSFIYPHDWRKFFSKSKKGHSKISAVFCFSKHNNFFNLGHQKTPYRRIHYNWLHSPDATHSRYSFLYTAVVYSGVFWLSALDVTCQVISCWLALIGSYSVCVWADCVTLSNSFTLFYSI